MKKPGKAKPKKRARKPAHAPLRAQAPAGVSVSIDLGSPAGKSSAGLETKSAVAVQVKPPVVKRQPVPKAAAKPAVKPSPNPPPVLRVAPATARRDAHAAQSNAARRSYSGDDRAALALLLAPFLIVAVSLGIGQARRTGLPPAPDVAMRAPLAAPVAAPAPVASALPSTASPLTASPLTASGHISYPPAQPEISVARLDMRPVPVAPPADVVVPGPAPAYPVAAPAIPTPPVQIAVPHVVVPGSLAYPPPAANITIAALDVRPGAPAILVTPPGVQPTPSSPFDTTETACLPSTAQLAQFSSIGRLARAPRQPMLTGVDPAMFGKRLSDAAVAQSRDLVIYTARYQPMAYPMGDVVALHGACIDVVIRAYRALGIDLQEEVQKARPSRGDPNIDHRRTENMRRFLAQKGTSLPITNFPENFKPGDIVTYHRPFSRVSTSHIAIVTDILAPTGRPMIVHNRGYGAQLEDALFVDRITGHYRYQGNTQPASRPVSRPAAPQPRSAAAPGAPVVRTSLPQQRKAD